MNMAVANSSVKKGETLVDTAMTLNAMHPDILVVRHHASGAVALLAQKVDCVGGERRRRRARAPDAGAARRAHHSPQQGRIGVSPSRSAATSCIPRVARSNIILLTSAWRAGARGGALDPAAGWYRAHRASKSRRDMREDLRGADIVMMLRLQRERMNGSFVPSTQEVFHYFGLDQEKLAYAKPDALADASRPDESRCRDRQRGGRWRAVADPRTGRNGRGGPHEPCSRRSPQSPNASTMLDRRPILLANARIVDPSRDLDFHGRPLGGGRRDPRGQERHPRGRRAGRHQDHRLRPASWSRRGSSMRAFIGEPGAEYRETLASASRAAAAGGVTTIICQPDTNPVIDDPAIVDFVLRRALIPPSCMCSRWAR